MTTPKAEEHSPETGTHHQQTETNPTTVTSVDDPSHPLHLHRRTVTDFDFGDAIGEGSYSTVLVARDKKTDKQYAVKKLDKAHIVKNDKVKYVMSERDALSRMNHPGIVKLYWTFRDNRSLYYVLDLAPYGELYTFIQKMAPLDVDTARYYASQILVALDHIHSKEVVHRDLKPENILLDDQMHIKIADFGSAKILSEDTVGHVSGTRSFVGTAEFVSPELLLSNPTHKEADWWAFGCVIFQMLSGRSPFKAATDYLIFQKIKNLDYEFPEDFPQVAMDLVQQLLVLDSEKRLGSKATGGVDSIKAHPFFQGIDFDQVFQQPAPAKALKYMEDLKQQQAEQRSKRANGDDFDSDDEYGFGTWLNGSGQQQQDNYFCPMPTIVPASSAEDSGPSPIVGSEIGTPSQQDLEPHSQISTKSPELSSSVKTSQINPGTSISAARMSDAATLALASSPVKDSLSSSHLPAAMTFNNVQTEAQGTDGKPSCIAYLSPSESIVRAGSVGQRRGLFMKKRYLILTDKPRLLYLDEGRGPDGSGGTLRNEIDWTPKLLPQLKSSTAFSISTPDKSYTFDVTKGQAEDWINAINTKLVDSFGVRRT